MSSQEAIETNRNAHSNHDNQQSRRKQKRTAVARKNTRQSFSNYWPTSLIPEWCELFTEYRVPWQHQMDIRSQLVSQQALIWSWQDTKNVTDAFEQTLERSVRSWESRTYGDDSYTVFHECTRWLFDRPVCYAVACSTYQTFWRKRWAGRYLARRTIGYLMGFDGLAGNNASRSVSNETGVLCAELRQRQNEQSIGKKKTKGMRRTQE